MELKRILSATCSYLIMKENKQFVKKMEFWGSFEKNHNMFISFIFYGLASIFRSMIQLTYELFGDILQELKVGV